MANPFPGMNPYLENPKYWPTVHASLIQFLWDDIGAKLPEGYIVSVEERIYIVEAASHFRADVAISHDPEYSLEDSRTSGSTLVADAPIIVATEEAREPYLNIWWGQDEEQLVTCIELLSPTNKTRGRGRNEYLRKQRALVESDTNLLEIDLLRGGEFTVAVPEDGLSPKGDYTVCLHRAGAAVYEVWPFSLRSRLPRIAVPLHEGDPDITVDLGQLMRQLFSRPQLETRLKYSEPLLPLLSPEDAAWVDELLRAAGKRA